MKIGIDCRLINETGVGRYLRNLVEELLKQDTKNTYVLFGNKEQLPQNKNVKIINTDIKWHTLKEQIIFPWIIWKEKCDLIHFPYFSVPIFYPGRFVVTIHDLIINHFDTGRASTKNWLVYKFKRWFYLITIWIAAHRAERVITVSNTTKEEIKKHLHINSERVDVTYEGISKISNIKNIFNNKYFLYVGNAYPHKNLEKLCEAFNKLQIQNSKLLFVGKQDFFYERLKNYVKTRKIQNVIFYGEAKDQELIWLYSQAIALIHPSLMEGFGLTIVEAMVNNCLVCCSDIPSLREITGGYVVFFNPLDVVSISKSIKEATIKNFTEQKEKAKNFVQRYSWQKMAKETLKIYENCLSL